MPSPAAVPPLAAFNDAAPVRQGALNALARHVEHLYTHLLGGWRTRKPLAHVYYPIGGGGDANLPGDGAAYFVNDYTRYGVDTELDHPDGRSTFVESIRIRTSGIYLLTGQAAVQQNTTSGGFLIAHLALNGVTLAQDAVARTTGRYIGGAASAVNLTVLQPLVAGSFIRFLVAQNSGTAAPLDPANGGCRLTAEWVAPLAAPEDLRED